jgi:hypothetical protein
LQRIRDSHLHAFRHPVSRCLRELAAHALPSPCAHRSLHAAVLH